ncbi:MAG: hypothetical protein GX344_07390 [Intrasporangiaceae bacterium]|nr:hypothetical protein [Intrasporangiaceae bacterium]
MPADRRRVLDELDLPLPPGAGILEALQIAVAVEDGCEVRLPEETLTVASLGRRDAIERVLDALDGAP